MMKNKPTNPKFGNAAPQAPEAEKAVLGAVIGFTDALNEVTFLTPGMFYDPRHRALFEAVIELKQKNTAIDIITVVQQIATMGMAAEVPIWFITETVSAVASYAHILDHALIIKQKYLQRQVLDFSMQVQSKAGTDAEDIGDVLMGAGREIEYLQEVLVGEQEESSYEEISRMFYEDINTRMGRFVAGGPTGIATGLTDLDRITSGWQNGDLVILAARPAMGKTAIALHFAQSAAKAGTPVLMFSLEMSKVSLYKRSVLSECDQISATNLKSGDLANDLPHIDRSVSQLCNLPIYVDDNANVNMAYIRAKSRLMCKKGQCRMVIIDYLQLITGDRNRFTGNREQEIAAMSREAKLAAKELNMPVILLSQLNRDVEKRHDKRPLLSDLRESGAIEQDADMVMFVHRPGYYKQEIKDEKGNTIENAGELIIAKYRNGATGKVRFRHNETITKVFDFHGTNSANPQRL